MNIFTLGTIVVSVVVTCITDITTGNGCTVGNVSLNICEKTDWSAWICSGCNSHQSSLTVRGRSVCCRQGDTRDQCLQQCNITGGVKETKPCELHCTTIRSTVTVTSAHHTSTSPTSAHHTSTSPTSAHHTSTSPTSAHHTSTSPTSAHHTSTSPTSAHHTSISGTITQLISANMCTTQPTEIDTVMSVNVCQLFSASLFLLGLLIGGIVVGLISLILHRCKAKKRGKVTPERNISRKRGRPNRIYSEMSYSENVKTHNGVDTPGYHHRQKSTVQLNEYPTVPVAMVEVHV